jgi:hypothetical protein
MLVNLTLQIRSGQGSQPRTQPEFPSSASGCSALLRSLLLCKDRINLAQSAFSRKAQVINIKKVEAVCIEGSERFIKTLLPPVRRLNNNFGVN